MLGSDLPPSLARVAVETDRLIRSSSGHDHVKAQLEREDRELIVGLWHYCVEHGLHALRAMLAHELRRRGRLM